MVLYKIFLLLYIKMFSQFVNDTREYREFMTEKMNGSEMTFEQWKQSKMPPAAPAPSTTRHPPPPPGTWAAKLKTADVYLGREIPPEPFLEPDKKAHATITKLPEFLVRDEEGQTLLAVSCSNPEPDYPANFQGGSSYYHTSARNSLFLVQLIGDEAIFTFFRGKHSMLYEDTTEIKMRYALERIVKFGLFVPDPNPENRQTFLCTMDVPFRLGEELRSVFHRDSLSIVPTVPDFDIGDIEDKGKYTILETRNTISTSTMVSIGDDVFRTVAEKGMQLCIHNQKLQHSIPKPLGREGDRYLKPRVGYRQLYRTVLKELTDEMYQNLLRKNSRLEKVQMTIKITDEYRRFPPEHDYENYDHFLKEGGEVVINGGGKKRKTKKIKLKLKNKTKHKTWISRKL
jgi:hypothetical protein